MRVDSSLATHLGAAASAAGAAAPADKGLFGEALAAASGGRRTAARTPAAPSAADPPGSARADARHGRAERHPVRHDGAAASAGAVPRGERYADVPGHAFDEIVDGPRNGMFINRSGNERDGQAFVLVRRDGRQFHVYGSGKDRLVVEVKHHRRRVSSDPPGERSHAPSAGGAPDRADAPAATRTRERRAPHVGAGAPAGAWTQVPAWARDRAAGWQHS